MCRSTSLFDVQGGLSIVMAPPSNVRAYSSTYSEGVKLLLHDPRIYASDLSVEKMISHKGESILRILPTLTECSQAVRDLPTNDRECLFDSEKELRFCAMLKKNKNIYILDFSFFKGYKENNCDVECRMFKMINYCGCLPYFYHNLTDGRVPTCNFTRITCLVDNYCLLKSEFFSAIKN